MVPIHGCKLKALMKRNSFLWQKIRESKYIYSPILLCPILLFQESVLGSILYNVFLSGLAPVLDDIYLLLYIWDSTDGLVKKNYDEIIFALKL